MGLAMAHPGTQFTGDGISLSWPQKADGTPGVREVIDVKANEQSYRVQRMIVEGRIEEVGDAATKDPGPDIRGLMQVMEGGTRAAQRHMAIPSGPVVRKVYERGPGGQFRDVEMGSTETRREEWPESAEPKEEASEPEQTREDKIGEMVETYTREQLANQANEVGIEVSARMSKLEIAAAIVDSESGEGEARPR